MCGLAIWVQQNWVQVWPGSEVEKVEQGMVVGLVVKGTVYGLHINPPGGGS